MNVAKLFVHINHFCMNTATLFVHKNHFYMNAAKLFVHTNHFYMNVAKVFVHTNRFYMNAARLFMYVKQFCNPAKVFCTLLFDNLMNVPLKFLLPVKSFIADIKLLQFFAGRLVCHSR